jgi:hypothetical protein
LLNPYSSRRFTPSNLPGRLLKNAQMQGARDSEE